MTTSPERENTLWRYARVLGVPLLILALVAGALSLPVLGWLGGEDDYDQAALQEWIDEARNNENTLADLVGKYIDLVNAAAAHEGKVDPPDLDPLDSPRERVNVASENI